MGKINPYLHCAEHPWLAFRMSDRCPVCRWQRKQKEREKELEEERELVRAHLRYIVPEATKD